MSEETENTAEDKSEFRCMYCNLPTLVYEPIITHLSPDEQYGFEGGLGDWVWVEEESEEGYRCQSCGSHCSVEEVYWWSPEDADFDLDAYFPRSIKGRTVILKNGDVWQITIGWFADGHYETHREQLHDSCDPHVLDDIPF